MMKLKPFACVLLTTVGCFGQSPFPKPPDIVNGIKPPVYEDLSVAQRRALENRRRALENQLLEQEIQARKLAAQTVPRPTEVAVTPAPDITLLVSLIERMEGRLAVMESKIEALEARVAPAK